jgi:predicted  nucleic acid-binding Zn-ribbon protein
MAEVEFAGLKVSGGKLLLAIPFLGSILAAMWGGFELYQRLLTAEQAVTEYVSPNFSTYDEALAVIDTKIDNFESLTTAFERELDRLQTDIDVVESIARSTDDTVAEAARELRDDVYALEERVNDSLRDINNELRVMRDDLEERIERILDNPLNTEE